MLFLKSIMTKYARYSVCGNRYKCEEPKELAIELQMWEGNWNSQGYNSAWRFLY